VDNYSETRAIKVVNKETGELVRTISANVHGSMCYNKYNDCLLIAMNGYIYLFFNPESISDNLDVSSADVTIQYSDGYTAYCWGEDDRTLYGARMYDETPSSNDNMIIEKLILGVDSNGDYNGNISKIITYSGKIVEGIDTYHGYGRFNSNYVQDVDFDGYLYIALGTSGNNFLVVDLDDAAQSFRVVGNYCYKQYNESRNEIFLEPELVVLDEQYIFVGSRNWDLDVYSLKRFVR
jgi:hypothetical protein